MLFFGKKWKCAVCGDTHRENAKFCEKCGTPRKEYRDRYDLFISYRRDGGGEVATIIQLALEKFGKSVFLDVLELQVGRFDERILEVIEKSDAFVLVMSQGCLDRCVNKSDWLKREILHAISLEKRIIPIHLPKFSFPDEDKLALLPDEMRVLPNLQAVAWDAANVDNTVRKILEAMVSPQWRPSGEVKTDGVKVVEPAAPNPHAQSARRAAAPSEEKHQMSSFVISHEGDALIGADDHGWVRKWSLPGQEIVSERRFPHPLQLEADPFGESILASTARYSHYQGDLYVISRNSLEPVTRTVYQGGVSSWRFGVSFSQQRIVAYTQRVESLAANGVWACDQLTVFDKASLAVTRNRLSSAGGHLLCASPDGNRVAVGRDSSIIEYDLATGELVRTVDGSDPAQKIQFCGPSSSTVSPDWQYFIHGSLQGRIRVHRCDDLELVSAVSAPLQIQIAGFKVSISPSGDRCVWSDEYGWLRIFSLPEAKPLASFEGATDKKQHAVWSCAFSPDSKLVCVYPSGGVSETISPRVINLDDGQLESRLHELAGGVRGAQFVGNTLYALDGRGRLMGWNINNWSQVCSFEFGRPSSERNAHYTGDREGLQEGRKQESSAEKSRIHEVSLPSSRKDESPEVIVSEPSGLELVRIPGGVFMLGSPEGEEGRKNEEGPQHEVRVGDFYLSRYPVTNAQWARYVKANPDSDVNRGLYADSNFNKPDQPMVSVTWNDAKAFCNWARLRFPSEAEWEYACRAATTTRFWKGDGEWDLAEVAWYADNVEIPRPRPVGGKPPNPFGLYDTHGTVWEWVEDDWHAHYNSRDIPTDGRAWVDQSRCIFRVLKGGSWNSAANDCRSASRKNINRGGTELIVGFRPAMTIQGR